MPPTPGILKAPDCAASRRAAGLKAGAPVRRRSVPLL